MTYSGLCCMYSILQHWGDGWCHEVGVWMYSSWINCILVSFLRLYIAHLSPLLRDARLWCGFRRAPFGLRRASLTAKTSLQTGVERSHRPQWRPSMVTLTGLGWRVGVPYRWGCFHLRIFPPFLAYVLVLHEFCNVMCVMTLHGLTTAVRVSFIFRSVNGVCPCASKWHGAQVSRPRNEHTL